MLMTSLGLPIPEFKLKRRVVITGTPDKNGDTLLSVAGRDIDGIPFSFFKEVSIVGVDLTSSYCPTKSLESLDDIVSDYYYS